MREYVPDNFERFVIYESEQERLEKIKNRLDYEWDMADTDREDWVDNENTKMEGD